MDELFSKLKRPFDGTWYAVESDMAVFERIMSRLPVKCVLMSKSVSKLWYDVMSTKYFIILHRYWSSKNTKFFVLYDAGDLEEIKVCEMRLMEPNGTFIEKYTIPGFETLPNLLVIASFNGLICCVNDVKIWQGSYEVDIRICNPATREVLVLPRSHLSIDIPTFGVLYSNRYHFYKIYKFFSEPIDLETGYTQCEVYSSKTGAWKQLASVPWLLLTYPSLSLVSNHVCINEKLYWFISDDYEDEIDFPTAILMVDMDDNFRVIPLPNYAEISFLIEFRGRLCFVDWTGLKFHLWLYDEKNDGWYLLDILHFPVKWLEVAHFDSVVAHKHDILFVYKDVAGLRHEILYDVSHGTWKDFRIAEDCKEKAIVVVPFFETLLPCNSNW